ncbi:MAG: SusC/RagA family TonB-linked outer membrane protein [Chitinophagaceae bacterium]|nr:MAG: SusC/RagA family TonB-linked outer membrane protein [Chitinophagaceae bacterium]
MKKWFPHPVFLKEKSTKKIWLAMKLSFVLMLAACLQVSAKAYSQNDVRLTLDLHNVKLRKVFSKIEKESAFRFLYSDDLVPVNKKINLQVTNTPLPEVLNTLLAKTDLHYKILSNNVIVIAKKGNVIQQHQVSGVVKDAHGNPLIGATVQVKGTNTGTATDAQGRFSLEVPDNAVLTISSVGYQSEDVSVGGRTSLNITLQVSSSTLNELVVTGYTTQKEKDITGSITSIKGSQLTTIPMGDAQKQLMGQVPGVTITTSGEPGGSSSVRIRGFGSFLTNDPLYVVDGVPTEDISYIAPDDIASITVLKDAAAATIYGARAFAGVILITTKQGKAGKLTVNYDVSYGRQYPGHGYSMLNPTQTAEWTWNAMKAVGETLSNKQYGTGPTPVLPDYLKAGPNYGLLNSDPATAALVDPKLYNINPADGPVYQIIKANKAGTNWYNAVTRVAPIQSHNLSLSGGTDNSKYNVQFGYFNQQGVVNETYLKRYSVRANTEFTIHNRVKIGENIQIALKDNPTLTNGNVGGNEGNAIGWSYRENPIIPVYDIMGNFAGTTAPGLNNSQNPVANQYRTKNNKAYNTDIFGNVYMDILLPYNITFHSSFGGDYNNYYYKTYTYAQYEDAENNPTTDYVYEGASYAQSWVWTNTLQFQHTYGAHYVKVLLGEEAQGGQGFNLDANANTFFTVNPGYTGISTASSSGRVVTDGGGAYSTLYSLFANVNYSYKDKYLLSSTVRRDGSANFGPQDKFGIFPAVSVGWRISNENFMKPVQWVNDLKLRGSYGEMGNASPVKLVNQYNTYTTSPEVASYDISGTGNSLTEGLMPNSIGVPNTHWETNKTLDFGADATLFNNSFNITVDWYKRTTTGLLYNPQVEATVGFLTSYPYINVGSMQNTGVEFQIDKHGDFAGNWHYDIGVNFTQYKNKIIKIADGTNYFYGTSYGATRIGDGIVTINKIGNPMSAFYGYKVVGLWQSQSEIDAADAEAQKATGNPNATYQSGGEHPGEFRYADVSGANGKPDGIIDANDRTIIGNPNPDFTYGINGNIGYKNWDLMVQFYGVWGGNIFNYTKWYTDFYSNFPGQAISTRVLKSWTPTNTNTNVPIFQDRSDASYNQVVNSYYIENGSYFRCRNLQFGYTFPKGTLTKAGINNLRVYVQAVNLFTITKYDGLDPAISGLDNNFGVDYGTYPFVRQYIVGANISF